MYMFGTTSHPVIKYVCLWLLVTYYSSNSVCTNMCNYGAISPSVHVVVYLYSPACDGVCVYRIWVYLTQVMVSLCSISSWEACMCSKSSSCGVCGYDDTKKTVLLTKSAMEKAKYS